MQSTKNVRNIEKNIELKQNVFVFRLPKLSLKWIIRKPVDVPSNDFAKLQTAQMNLAKYTRDQDVKRAQLTANYYLRI